MRRRSSLVLAALILATPACDSKSSSPPPSTAAEPTSEPAADAPLADRDPALAHQLVEQGALLLDVRTPDEFAEGHIEGAVNIPHDQVADEIERIGELTGGDKSKAIVVYCRSGRRSGMAKQTLAEHGYGRVSNLGGMSDW